MEKHSDNPSTLRNSGRNKSTILHLFLLCLLLVIITLPIYLQVATFDFIKYDDNSYVENNPIISNGITFDAIKKAFTSVRSANWHPLTWISHMIDVHFFGMNPGMHHLINVFFHIANAILLFLGFYLMT
ncbi:hypothetical protein EG832_11780, partial [bacterium]|nr:hypothetical protein [bacterium]